MAPEQQLRLYNITDPEMYEDAKLKRGFFIEDKADFIAFDADFADPFADDWLTLIDEAEALPQDEVIDDQLTQLTDIVEEKLEDCRKKFQDSKYFIEKAFPKKPNIWNEFGFDNYNAVRKLQGGMINFMKNFHSIAEKYKVTLIAANYTQLMIDDIKTKGDALDTANQNQDQFNKNIPVQTEARHAKNNEVWNTTARVCTAGKRIYINNYGKYQRYLLPPGEESPEALSITGLVSDQANGNPLQGVTLGLDPVGLTTGSAADGRYGFGGLPDGDYTLKVSLADYVDQNIPVTITGGNAVEVNVQLVHV